MENNHGLDTVWLARLLKKSVHLAKPSDVVDVEVNVAVPKGENYTSLVYRVKLICLLASGKRKSISMIVKTELKSDHAKETLAAFPVFRSEIRNYTTILTNFEDFMQEHGDKRELLWPNFYGYVPYKVVAMEDLTQREYAVAQRRNCLDLQHALLVLRNIARFHAMGKVLIAKGILNKDDKGSFVMTSKEDAMKKMWEALFTVMSDAMANDWGKEWADISKKMKTQITLASEKIFNLADEYDEKFEVLNHGDLWTCNMMFRYLEYENVPISVRFVDYQICHMNSFIWDVEYFLTTSVIPPIRRANKDLLHKTYQHALETNLKYYNYSGYIPTLEDVKNESTRILYGQMALCLFNPLMSAETTNAFDMEKVMTHDPKDVLDDSVFSDGKAHKWLGDDFKYYAKIGII